MRCYTMILLAVGVGVLLVAASASANVVNVTTGTTLFYDDFETSPNGVSTVAYPDSSGDYNPVAQPQGLGRWAKLTRTAFR